MNKEEIFKILYGKEVVEVYRDFQKIENSIDDSDELYEYFYEIKDMLFDEMSFIRLRGFRIICKLAKWDKENKIEDIINVLLDVLDDDKPTIVRQCLQALPVLILYKPQLSNMIQEKLMQLDCSNYKDSMSPLIEKDISQVLKQL